MHWNIFEKFSGLLNSFVLGNFMDFQSHSKIFSVKISQWRGIGGWLRLHSRGGGGRVLRSCPPSSGYTLTGNTTQMNRCFWTQCYLINPSPSLSNTLNVSLSSSCVSHSFIFFAIMTRNSSNSIVPLPTKVGENLSLVSYRSLQKWNQSISFVPLPTKMNENLSLGPTPTKNERRFIFVQ